MKINFIERGKGFPQKGDILISHEGWGTAYRVLEDRPGTGDGIIVTGQSGQPNECLLHIEEVDYDEYRDDPDAWEV